MLNKIRRWAEGKIRNTGKAVVRTVVFVFLAVYFLSMLLSTYLMQREFAEEYRQAEAEIADQFQVSQTASEYSLQMSLVFRNQVSVQDFLCDILYRQELAGGKGNHLISAAVYSQQGELLVQSEPMLGAVSEKGTKYRYKSLSDYLTEEQIACLAWYKIQNGEIEMRDTFHQYEFDILLARNRKDPARIQVWEETWEQFDSLEEYNEEKPVSVPFSSTMTTAEGDFFGKMKEKLVWRWVNPDVPEEQQDPTTYQGPSFLWFPAGEAGYKAWEKWENSAYLQQFPGHMDENQLREEVSREGCRRERKIFFSLQQENGPTYLLTIRSESHPWKAAVDQLKYVYFISFLFVAGCGIFTLRVLEKTYSQRARMEEQRKDFMNVMAHEIKTPLGVIRGFSENLRENPHSEKRDYYLSQMIRQTEEIDTLVKDMITVTRMDWEQLEIKKTPVSLWEVLDRELERLAVLAEEKRIQIISCLEEDWILPGDRRFLEEAFYNLLSNAAAYNREEGRIRVILTEGSCVVENTGKNIPPEHLPHLCEMFYTVQAGAGGREKHLGMGLYLSRQIFLRHGLQLKIENTEEGVRVTVEK